MPRLVEKDGIVHLGWSERDLANSNLEDANGKPLGPRPPLAALNGIRIITKQPNFDDWLKGQAFVTSCGGPLVNRYGDVMGQEVQAPLTCLACMADR